MKRLFAILICIFLLLATLPLSAGAKEGPKLLAITFDDGPSRYTEQLLDGLKTRKAKATFFMVGSNVSLYPETIRRMKKEGHQLATHTMTHANLATLSSDKILKEVEGVDQRLNQIVGSGNYYLRPPYGSYNKTVKSTVNTPMVHWSVDTEDWRYRDSESVYQKIIRSTHDGDIILLHDLYKTSVDGALKAIDTLQSQGYVFVTVEQLLRRRGIAPENGQIYFDAPNQGINLPAVVSPVISTRTTVLGTKVMIARFSPADKIYYTADGKKPDTQCPLYDKPYYVEEKQTVQAVSVGESELSSISSVTVDPAATMDKQQLDKAYYCYQIPFLKHKSPFVIGMKA